MINVGIFARYLLRKNVNGQTEVVDTKTGQVRFTGSLYEATLVRAKLMRITCHD